MPSHFQEDVFGLNLVDRIRELLENTDTVGHEPTEVTQCNEGRLGPILCTVRRIATAVQEDERNEQHRGGRSRENRQDNLGDVPAERETATYGMPRQRSHASDQYTLALRRRRPGQGELV